MHLREIDAHSWPNSWESEEKCIQKHPRSHLAPFNKRFHA